MSCGFGWSGWLKAETLYHVLLHSTLPCSKLRLTITHEITHKPIVLCIDIRVCYLSLKTTNGHGNDVARYLLPTMNHEPQPEKECYVGIT